MSTILVDFRAWKSSSEISEMLALLKDAAQFKGAVNGNKKHKKRLRCYVLTRTTKAQTNNSV
jgi:hypothetical protein